VKAAAGGSIFRLNIPVQKYSPNGTRRVEVRSFYQFSKTIGRGSITDSFGL
jgi:hypothetical protein